MDKDKQPGIIFENVYLTKLNFQLPATIQKNNNKTIPYEFQFTKAQKIENNKLIIELSVKLFDGFELTVIGIFGTKEDEKNMELEQFAESNAPALLFPYIREIVSSITAKSPLPTLRLPPINLVALLNKKKIEADKNLISEKK
jgi:preprotein translocase subunit SecB